MPLAPCFPQELPLSHSDIIQIAGLGAAYAAMLMAALAYRKSRLLRPIEYGCYFGATVFMCSTLSVIIWRWKPTWAGGGLYKLANYGTYFGLVFLIMLFSMTLFLLIFTSLSMRAISKEEREKLLSRRPPVKHWD